MKKLTFAALALAALASCTPEETVPQKNQLMLASGITSRVVENTWEANDDIGVTMTNSSTNATIGTANTQFTTADGGTMGVFSSTTPMYFPTNVDKVDVRAYYPYSSTLENDVLELDMDDKTDLIIGYRDDVSSTSDPITLFFEHVLARVNVTISAGSGITASDLAGATLSLSGTYTRADFTISGYNKGNKSSTTHIDNYAGKEELKLTSTNLTSTGIVIPQDITSSLKVYIDLPAMGTTFVTDLTTTSFNASENHDYFITITREGAVLNGGTITPWGNDTDSSDNNGTATEL